MTETKSIERQSGFLIDIVASQMLELFHNPNKETFVTFPLPNGGEQAIKIESKEFEMIFSRIPFKQRLKAPSDQTLKDVGRSLSAEALFDGSCKETHLRSAMVDGVTYYDLGDPTYQAVKITTEGWEVVTNTPCVFLRPNGMHPLPLPQIGSNLDNLRSLLQIADDSTWCLIVAWLLAAMRPTGPYPVLVLTGEPGAGKSLAARLLGDIIDPHGAGLRSLPRSNQDLAIAAANNKVLSFDNISSLSEHMSDALCRLSTGGSHATRKLYSNDEEVLMEAQVPLILTGIEDFVTRSDLADRSIIIEMQKINDKRRQSEKNIYKSFKQNQGLFLGALLDLYSAASKLLPGVDLRGVPRLADFAYWGSATEQAAGWPQGSFLAAFHANQNAAILSSIEHSDVARATVEFAQKERIWSGTHQALLDELGRFVSEPARRAASWPKTSGRLAGELRRLASQMRRVSVFYTHGRQRTRHSRVLTLEFRTKEPSRPSHLSPDGNRPAEIPGSRNDNSREIIAAMTA